MDLPLNTDTLVHYLHSFYSGAFPMGCYAVDLRSNKIIYCNSLFFQLWDIKEHEAALRAGNLNHGQLVSLLRKKMHHAVDLHIPDGIKTGQLFIDTADKEINLSNDHVLRHLCNRLLDSDNHYLADVHLFEDLTPKKLTEAVLYRSYHDLEKVSKEQNAQLIRLQDNLNRETQNRIKSDQSLQEELSRAAIVTGMISKMMSILELPALLDMVCHETATISNAACSNISLFDEKSDLLIHTCSYHAPDDFLKRIPGFPGTIYREFIGKRVPINIIPNICDIPFVPGASIYKEYNIATAVTLPLILGKKLIGSLNLFFHDKGHPITPNDQRVLIAIASQASICIHNAILYQETRQKTWELKVLADISYNLQKTDSVNDMLKLIIQTAQKNFGADSVWVSIPVDDSFQLISLSAARRLQFNHISPAGQDVIRRFMEEEDLVFFPSINERIQLQLNVLDIQIDPAITSMVIIPMKSVDRSIGLLTLGFNYPQELTPSQKNSFYALTNISGNALFRAFVVENLEKSVEDRTKVLSVLYEITRGTSSLFNSDAVFTIALEKTLAAIDCIFGIVDTYQPETDTLSVAKILGQHLHHGASSDFLSVHSVLSRQVFDQQKTITQAAPHRSSKTPSKANPFCYIGVPLTVRDKKLGVISLYRNTAGDWRDEEINLVKSVVDQVALAVENLKLREDQGKLALMEERSRLARELHDSVTQSLYSLSLFAEAGKQSLKAQNYKRLKQNLDTISDTATQALKEMRLLIFELRPPDLEKVGLAGVLRKRLYAIEQRVGIAVNFRAEELPSFPPEVEISLYHIAQEVLNNSLKHAQATQVEVNLNKSAEGFVMRIRDNGIGFDLQNVEDMGGMGLPIIRERAQSIGAQLLINTCPGNGTEVIVKLSYPG